MLLKPMLRYFFSAGNEHDLHSPFLFDFYKKAVQASELPPEANQIEALRKATRRDSRVIEITDFGAGSRWNKSNARKISTIAKTSEKSQKWQAILFRIIKNYYANSTIIELGTSLGITTSYLAIANPTNRIVTFEGCPEIADVAQQNFKNLQFENISQVVGNIDETLLDFLRNEKIVDVVFFDANHRYEPTVRYFELCLAKSHENSMFVFDDIYWSEEMRQAWKEIKAHESVRQTLDFWQIGIVLFRKSQPKQHFRLKA